MKILEDAVYKVTSLARLQEVSRQWDAHRPGRQDGASEWLNKDMAKNQAVVKQFMINHNIIKK